MHAVTESQSTESPSNTTPVDLDAEYRELCYLRHFYTQVVQFCTEEVDHEIINNAYLGPIPKEYQNGS